MQDDLSDSGLPGCVWVVVGAKNQEKNRQELEQEGPSSYAVRSLYFILKSCNQLALGSNRWAA